MFMPQLRQLYIRCNIVRISIRCYLLQLCTLNIDACVADYFEIISSHDLQCHDDLKLHSLHTRSKIKLQKSNTLLDTLPFIHLNHLPNLLNALRYFVLMNFPLAQRMARKLLLSVTNDGDFSETAAARWTVRNTHEFHITVAMEAAMDLS